MKQSYKKLQSTTNKKIKHTILEIAIIPLHRSCRIESDCSNLLTVNEHTGGLVGSTTVMGGGEDCQKTAMLLELEWKHAVWKNWNG